MGEAPGETLQNAEPPVNEEKDNPAQVTQALQAMYERARDGANVDKIDDDGTSNIVATSTTTSKGEEESNSTISLLHGLKTLARTSQMWISVGGMHVLGAPPHPETNKTRFYNTHFILDDTGTVRAVYRKIHLFDVQIPDKVNLMESNSTAGGQEVVLCDTPVGECLIQATSQKSCDWPLIWVLIFCSQTLKQIISGRLGITTCYDMRFPELYRKLVDQGAEIMLMPSAFTVPTGQAHWHILLRGTCSLKQGSHVVNV